MGTALRVHAQGRMGRALRVHALPIAYDYFRARLVRSVSYSTDITPAPKFNRVE
jgi:hypothetical protein